ncbi:MAG: hypothetical protein RIR10_1098 [Planctomycetota bacterium]
MSDAANVSATRDVSDPSWLDVVIVNFNTRDITLDCLASIERTTLGSVPRVLLVDNASVDSSVDAIRARFPWVEVIASTENLGFARGNNLAIRRTTADIVLLLNSDTIVSAGVLEESAEMLRKNPGVAIASCRVRNRDGSPQASCLNLRTVWSQLLGFFMLRRSNFSCAPDHGAVDVPAVAGCVMFCDGAWLRARGGFDERFPFFGEDVDLCRQAHAEGKRVCVFGSGDIVHLGGASCEQTGGRRDGLLVNSDVILARKWEGLVASWAQWLIWVLYLTTRGLGYGLRWCLFRDERSWRRFSGGWQVLRGVMTAPPGQARFVLAGSQASRRITP